jgi:hypothetical protein
VVAVGQVEETELVMEVMGVVREPGVMVLTQMDVVEMQHVVQQVVQVGQVEAVQVVVEEVGILLRQEETEVMEVDTLC